MLPQDTTHLIQSPCNQRESPCQDPEGNRTARRPPDLQWYGHVSRSSGLAKTISRLDYCNSAFCGLSSTRMSQNASESRTMQPDSYSDHVTLLRRLLHRLPVSARIQYKIDCIICYECIYKTFTCHCRKTDSPLTQRSRSGLTVLSRHSVGTYELKRIL